MYMGVQYLKGTVLKQRYSHHHCCLDVHLGDLDSFARNDPLNNSYDRFSLDTKTPNAQFSHSYST